MFERYHRGTLPELAEEFAEEKPKGEITVLIEGLSRKSKRDEGED